jgi:deazaflavin-dependent oxidoreductase (nitroreductase family)
MSEFNDTVIAEFRANKGVVGGFFANATMLLLHVKGRKSGRELVTPLLYLSDGDDYVLLGSNGGAEREPLWFGNVEAAETVQIEVGERTLTAKPVVLREGPERDALYSRFVEYWPDARDKYELNTDRPFPLVRLVPVGD